MLRYRSGRAAAGYQRVVQGCDVVKVTGERAAEQGYDADGVLVHQRGRPLDAELIVALLQRD